MPLRQSLFLPNGPWVPASPTSPRPRPRPAVPRRPAEMSVVPARLLATMHSDVDQISQRACERRRAELGKFLKARRARLSPGDFGMPPGSRRRTPGLRREEVALLAGVGVTWYTWLEQGRQINASTQVLDAVARTLRLDRAEREHLYRLAEATPLRTECTRLVVPDTIREIVYSLEPLPASLTNGRFDILVSNDASEELFWD